MWQEERKILITDKRKRIFIRDKQKWLVQKSNSHWTIVCVASDGNNQFYWFRSN
jgi:hypothetical protein